MKLFIGKFRKWLLYKYMVFNFYIFEKVFERTIQDYIDMPDGTNNARLEDMRFIHNHRANVIEFAICSIKK